MKKVTRIIIPLSLILLASGIFFGGAYKKYCLNKDLDLVLAALYVNQNANNLFDNEKEKQEYLNSLLFYYHKLDSIKHQDSIYSFLIGKNEKKELTIKKTLNVLKEQIIRYKRLNILSTGKYSYDIEKYDSTDIQLITSNYLKLENINIAFKLKNTSDTVHMLHIKIEDSTNDSTSTLFSQFYLPNKNINSFIIPNYIKDGVIVKLGYITTKSEVPIFKYTVYEEEK